MICLDTRGLCFLCYKSCEDSLSLGNLGSVDGDESFDSGRTSDQDESNGESHFYSCSSDTKNDDGVAKQTNLFCKTLFRVLGFQPLDQCTNADTKQNMNKHNDKQLQICTDCLRIARNVCEICHQINSLQLLLNWKLMRIRDTMRSADKAPSRSSAFKNVFKSEEKSKSSQSESPKADNRRLPQEEFYEIQSLRKNIIQKCTERLQNASPKVFITRLKQDNQKENDPQLLGECKDQNDCFRLHINTTDKNKDDINVNLIKCEKTDDPPQTAIDQHNCSKCSMSFSNEKSLLSHLKTHPIGDNSNEKEQIYCDKVDTTEAVAVLEVKSNADTSESDSILDLPVEAETHTVAPKCSKSQEQVEKLRSEQEEDEPPPVPIEIDTKLAQKKESDNDEDFHPSDIDEDDISSDECGVLELNCSTEKKEGRKRKRKVKGSSYGVKDGRTSKKLKL